MRGGQADVRSRLRQEGCKSYGTSRTVLVVAAAGADIRCAVERIGLAAT